MNKALFIELLRKVRTGTATAEEQQLVEAYYHLVDHGVDDENVLAEIENGNLKELIRAGIDERVAGLQQPGGAIKPVMRKLAVAATMLLLAGASGLYITTSRKQLVPEKPPARALTAVMPGGSKAVLTLSNGMQVELDSLSASTPEADNIPGVTRRNNGELIYEKRAGSGTDYNTLTTPRGGEYKIVLSDGTRIWLNAGSSLKYPTAFNDGERKVILQGEAYFEVAPAAAQPFTVEAGSQQIKVLGTHFNVQSYGKGTAAKTTLAEGKVKVISGNSGVLLLPGQAAVTGDDGELLVEKADMERALAWKNGLFYFEDTDIVEIMKEVERWYDVTVAFEKGTTEGKRLSGVISRYEDITELLKRLELTGIVRFRIEGRKIFIIK